MTKCKLCALVVASFCFSAFQVSAQTGVSISPTTLPSGLEGTPYITALTATGGTPPYFWSYDVTTLPPGLTGTANSSLSSPDGIPSWFIYGTPTNTGTFTFFVTVTDNANNSDSETITINISSAPASETVATYKFDGVHGSMPNAIIQAADGNFYGTTTAGGTTLGKGICFDSNGTDVGCGTVFRMSPSGSITSLASFAGTTGGWYPTGLIQGEDGNFYGTTLYGGSTSSQTTSSCEYYDGTLNPDGSLKPTSNLGCGTIFQVTPAGSLQILYSFPGAITTTTTPTEGGSFPNPLTLGANGVIFGTTGACNNPLGSINPVVVNPCDSAYGIVYEFTTPPTGTSSLQPQIIYTFTSTNSGYPNSLLLGSDGNLYGTTQITTSNGEPCQQYAGCGSLFQLTVPSSAGQSGTLQTLFDFLTTSTEYGNLSSQIGAAATGAMANHHPRSLGIIRQPSRGLPTGGSPWALDSIPTALIEASDGSLYGTTPTEDEFSTSYQTEGTLFHYTPPNGTATGGILDTISLADWNNGLILAADSNYYGMADSSVFQVSPNSAASTPVSQYANLPGTVSALIQGSDGNFYGTGQDSANGFAFKVLANPAIAGPVQLKLSSNKLSLNSSATLSWTAVNAFSLTARQCYALTPNSPTGAGSWTLLQKGTVTSGVYTGTQTIQPTQVGVFNYALTCGGTESASSSLTVSTTPTVTVMPSSSSYSTAQALSVQVSVSGGSGNPTPTGSVTLTAGNWSSSAAALGSGSATLNIPAGTLATGTDTLTAQYLADATSSPFYTSASGQISVSITNPNYSLAGTAVTATPGAPATSTITVSSSNGYAGTVSLSCAVTGSPAGAVDLPTCSSGNQTVALSSSATSGTASVTLNTIAPLSALVLPKDRNHPEWLEAGGTAMLAVLFFCGIPESRRRWRLFFVLCLTLTVLGSFDACGGGSSTPPPKDPGTTPGPYTITVTGTGNDAAKTSETTTFILTVN